jgi:hypothetical protein
MADPLVLVQSRTLPFPVEQAFAFTLAAPLPAIFSRWWGPLPPISGVDGPEPWGTPGQVRHIRTADGASMREELLTADAPDRFTYRLTEVAGALRLLFASVDGSWAFQPVGAGTRVTWSWTIHPASAAASVVLPVVGLLWKGYARRALDRLDEMMVDALSLG